MNILAPFSWLKEFLDTELDAVGYAKAASLIGNEAEHLLYPASALRGIVVGRVKEIKRHPNADALQIAMTDVGDGAPKQIVCGGENLAEGQTVAVALPGARVKWHGKEEVTLEETEVRGQKSFGMICAADELGFEKLANGKTIWDLSSLIPEAKPGDDLATALGLKGEVVLDFEVTTNRPDALSIIGQAREGYAGSFGTFEEPFLKQSVLPNGETKIVFKVENTEHELCSRYMGVVMDVEVGPSPWWMQRRLLLAGAKPINNVVDVTNYVRLELGQPLHAFDYERIEGGKIVVRRAKQGEHFRALDETEHELLADMLVIADAKRAVAIAGIMGGFDSGVTVNTKRIILEAATFNAQSIRKTWRALNLQSDSQQLYEKGLSLELPAYGIARAVELLKEVANARVASTVEDARASEDEQQGFALRPKRTSALMGVSVDSDIQRALLERLGFRLSAAGEDVWTARVPFWRAHDVEADVDLMEEIARLYGYHNLPSVLPSGEIPRRERDTLLDREGDIKDLLSGIGLTEVYANSFVDPEDVLRAGMNPRDALRVQNPLAEDQALMRTSLIPTMLRTIADNQRLRDTLRLFELQRVYRPRPGDLPEERSMLLLAVSDAQGGEDLFRCAKGLLERLMNTYRVQFEFLRQDVPHWAHPGMGASIRVGGEIVGTIAQVHPLLLQAFDLEMVPVLVELDLPLLEPYLKLAPTYQEPPVFPFAYRDISLLADEATTYEAIERVLKTASMLVRSIEAFDVYRGSQIGEEKKSLSMHLTFGADDRTLTSKEVEEEMSVIAHALSEQLAVAVRE